MSSGNSAGASSSKAATGDGMGGHIPSSSDNTDTVSELASVAARYMRSHGVPTKLPEAEFTKRISRINALVGAKTQAQKEEVANLLAYVGIVHGTGPNVDWENIAFEPEGCKAVVMSEIIDKIVTRKYCRRFFTHFGHRAAALHDASPELQLMLQERAVRNGVPITETKAVIDFIPVGSGMSPGTALYRSQAKYSAVRRAIAKGANSLERQASAAGNAMHKYTDEDNDSLGGL